MKSCKKRPGHRRKPLPEPVRIGAKTVAGAGIGVAAVFLGSAAASLVGGAALIHLALLKLGAGAGLAGGGIGLYRGLTSRKAHKSEKASTSKKNKDLKQTRQGNGKE
jgi:hypothetical protein